MNKEPLTLEELRETAGKPVYCPEMNRTELLNAKP